MITYSFSVKSKKRLIELQSFIRSNMPTARFKGNPYSFWDEEKYDVTLMYEIEDMNKLHVLTNKWYEIDNPRPARKKSFFRKLFNL